MDSRIGVAVFARTPGSGGKSRLASTWGRDRTDAFYAHCLRCAGEWLRCGRTSAVGYWALTGPGPRDASVWNNGSILEQGEGGLGERMAEIVEQLQRRHQYWCLTGTDIPHMPPLSRLQISKRLEQSDFIFAPSSDGGFWLVAGRLAIPRHVWVNVKYSREDTLAQMLVLLRQTLVHTTVGTLLPTLTDIDQQKDLISLKNNLLGRSQDLNMAQHLLLQWLQNEEMLKI